MNIDLDQLLEIALKGVRRSAAFLALGVNSARDPGHKAYRFSDNVPTQILPDNFDEKAISNLKTEFEKWVILSSLRELIETFAVYLDGVHRVCLIAASNKGTIQPEDVQKFEQAFERKGLEKKFKTLKNRFCVETPKGKYLVGISKARNCLAHRRGVIAANDVGSDETLRVTWWALNLFAATPDGGKVSLMPPLPEGGILIKEGASIRLDFVDREREFKVGQVLELTVADLAEICVVVNFAAREVLSSAIQFLKTQGAVISGKNRQNSNE